MRNLVDPDLLAGLDMMPSFAISAETLAEARVMIDQMGTAMPEPVGLGVTWRDAEVQADAGRTVPVRIYYPQEATEAAPAILHIHGGGFVAGSIAMQHASTIRLTADTAAVVVSVDYRLAPETKAPGSVEDCFAALAWLHDNATELGVDPARIAIRGESAGGGLAAALALLARDRNGPPIIHQNLIYPMLDDRTCITSQPSHLGAIAWTPKDNVFGWESLLGQKPGAGQVAEYAVPARAVDLAGLPPAFIAVGALDLFVIEDMDYARHLIEAGVPAELHVYPGAFHGFDAFADAYPSKQLSHDAISALRRALHGQ